MHIKQITISNFRSFKQQPEIQPFSPGTNSVVGRNGSGKSNLFDAVQFVLLAPRFYTLRTVRTKPTRVFWRQISIRFRLCCSSSKECSWYRSCSSCLLDLLISLFAIVYKKKYSEWVCINILTLLPFLPVTGRKTSIAA